MRALLDYGDALDVSNETPALSALVVPRLGTISPWASKATDIAKNCGIEAVRRIERGTLYRVYAEKALSDAEKDAVQALLHDRMTESVVDADFPPEELFVELASKPMASVDLLGQGRAQDLLE